MTQVLTVNELQQVVKNVNEAVCLLDFPRMQGSFQVRKSEWSYVTGEVKVFATHGLATYFEFEDALNFLNDFYYTGIDYEDFSKKVKATAYDYEDKMYSPQELAPIIDSNLTYLMNDDLEDRCIDILAENDDKPYINEEEVTYPPYYDEDLAELKQLFHVA